MELRDKRYIEDIQERVKKGYFHDYYGPIKSINFLIDGAHNNQIYYYIAMQASKLLQERSDINIATYLLNFNKPCFWPMFALFPIREFQNYAEIGIATSLLTVQYLANTKCRNKYYYVYDITEISTVSPEKLRTILDGFKIFTRNDEYANIIKNTIPSISIGTHVPDFNLNKIMENING